MEKERSSPKGKPDSDPAAAKEDKEKSDSQPRKERRTTTGSHPKLPPPHSEDA